MRSLKLNLLILSSVVALAACSKDEPQYVQPPIYQPQPQVTQAVPQQQPQVVYQQAAPQGNNDMLIGGIMGYMLGGAGNRGGGGSAGGNSPVTNHTTTVNKTIVNKTYVQPKPNYSAPRSYSSPSYGGRRK